MANVTRFEAQHPSQWKDWLYQHPAFPRPTRGKLFLGEKLGLEAMEVSLNSMAPGAGMPFSHRHRSQEELYLFLEGRGEMTVDGESFAIGPGSSVRVAPDGVRSWRNTGDVALLFVVIQACPSGAPVRGIADGEVVPT